MGIPRENSFPRTTELIQGIDYLVRQALVMGRPMVINLSLEITMDPMNLIIKGKHKKTLIFPVFSGNSVFYSDSCLVVV